MRFVFYLFVLMLAIAWPLSAAPGVSRLEYPGMDPEDRRLLLEKFGHAQSSQFMSERCLQVGLSFKGTPYVSGLLDANRDEQMVVNLRMLDCWTFVENCIAIAQCADAPQVDMERQYLENLQALRYRNGKIDTYTSRIHYFSEWLLQAEQNGVLNDITLDLGGISNKKDIFFMSAHADRYPQLRDPKALAQIQEIEKNISKNVRDFIPQEKVAKIEPLLKDGDLIAITSAKSGLDFTHEGFAVRRNGRIHLLHASSLNKKVIISAQPLAEYLLSQKGQTGIVVLRLK